jgi:hypothetical protein
MDENLTPNGDSSFASTIRGDDLPPLTTEVDSLAVTGRSKRSRTASVKSQEHQEFEDAVKAVTSNKVRRPLSNSTNQSFTIDGEDAGKSFSTSSSNDASTTAHLHTDSSVCVAQKPPSNADRLRQKPTISRREQLQCDFNNIESVNKLFLTQKGKGQFNCPWRFINEAEDAVGKRARVMLWRGYSRGQQKDLINQIYSTDKTSAPITSRRTSVADTSEDETQEQPSQERQKRTYNVARNLSANVVPFGEVGDLDDPFNRVIASEDRSIVRQQKKKASIHYYLCTMNFYNNLLMIHTS